MHAFLCYCAFFCKRFQLIFTLIRLTHASSIKFFLQGHPQQNSIFVEIKVSFAFLLNTFILNASIYMANKTKMVK